jgi:hypothetical protein
MLISLTNNPVAKSILDRFIQTQGLSLTPIGKIAQLDSLDEQQREHWQKAHTAYATSLTPFFE